MIFVIKKIKLNNRKALEKIAFTVFQQISKSVFTKNI
jgi:hypothetical protein